MSVAADQELDNFSPPSKRQKLSDQKMVRCQGKLPDGAVCGWPLGEEDNFCGNCGTEKKADTGTVPCPGRPGKPCGKPLEVLNRFCPACGLKVDPSWFNSCPDTLKCRTCSTSLRKDDHFCSMCGTPVSSEEIPVVHSEDTTSSSASAEGGDAAPGSQPDTKAEEQVAPGFTAGPDDDRNKNDFHSGEVQGDPAAPLEALESLDEGHDENPELKSERQRTDACLDNDGGEGDGKRGGDKIVTASEQQVALMKMTSSMTSGQSIHAQETPTNENQREEGGSITEERTAPSSTGGHEQEDTQEKSEQPLANLPDQEKGREAGAGGDEEASDGDRGEGQRRIQQESDFASRARETPPDGEEELQIFYPPSTIDLPQELKSDARTDLAEGSAAEVQTNEGAPREVVLEVEGQADESSTGVTDQTGVQGTPTPDNEIENTPSDPLQSAMVFGAGRREMQNKNRPDISSKEEKRSQNEELQKEADPLNTAAVQNQNKPSTPQQSSAGGAEGIPAGHFYKKERHETPSRGRRGQQKNSNVPQNEQNVEVEFHVLISKDFHWDQSKRVGMVFGATELGGWNQVHGIDVVGEVGPHVEAVGKIWMPKATRNRGIFYKYVVVTFKSKDQHSIEHEHLYSTPAFPSQIVNRRLGIPLEKKSSPTWVQYDGIAYPPPNQSLWNSIKGFFRNVGHKIRNDIQFAASHFFPKPSSMEKLVDLHQTEITAERLLADLADVMNTMKGYMMDEKMEREDQDFAKECIGEYIVNPLKKVIVTHNVAMASSSKEKDAGRSAVIPAVLCLLVHHEYKMPIHEKLAPFVFRAMAVHPTESKTCPEWEAVQRHFSSQIKIMHEKLVAVIRKHAGTSYMETDATWLNTIPLIHFLQGVSKPYCPVEVSHKHATEEFWGMKGLEPLVKSLKKGFSGNLHSWNPPMEKMLEEMLPAFQVDLMMSRTFMAGLDLCYLPRAIGTGHFSPDACAAAIYYYWTIRAQFLLDEEYKAIMESSKSLQEVFNNWVELNCPQESPRLDPESEAYLRRFAWILRDLMEKIIGHSQKRRMSEPLHLVFSIFITCLDILAQREENHSDDGNPEHWKICWVPQLRGCTTRVMDCLQRNFSMFTASKADFESNLKIWNAFVEVGQKSRHLGQWVDSFAEAFEYDALKVSHRTCFHFLCDEDLSGLSDAIQAKTQNVLYQAFEGMMTEGGSVNASEKTGRLMSRMLEDKWPDNEQNLLQFILTWTPVKLCLEKFYGHEEVTKYLTDKSSCYLTKIIDELEKAETSLRTGRIALADLELMRKRQQSLESVLLASKSSKAGVAAAGHVEQLMLLLQAREEEVNAFHEHLELVRTLLDLLHHISMVDSTPLMASFQELQEGKKCLLHELCTPREEDLILTETSEPVVNPLELPDDVLTILPALHKWQASSLFMNMWCEEAGKYPDTEVFDGVLEVWNMVNPKWTKLCTKVQDGSITFAEMDHHLSAFVGDEPSIKKELELMTDRKSTAWVQERMDQLKQYHAIENCQRGAKVIMDFKRRYDITGDYQPVQRILDLGVDRNVKMSKLNREVWGICEDLQGITAKQVACLKELQNCKELIEWLKASLPGGLKELKVFVDLAFISAGEGDMEIDKVNCFHAAVTGYAPLIFDVDKNTDYKKFLDRCQHVWKELESDSNLPEKLSSTRRFLPWLKMVRQSHGSVEVTALSQAKTINERGIYRVGNISKSSDLPVLDLESVVDLMVTPNGQQVLEARNYSHKQLIDLQSRLMLVAGQAEKGKDNVEKFTMVLDAIIRLGRVYISLCTDGCVLFNCWRAKFLCEEERPLCTVVEFGLGDNREALKAKRGQRHLEVFIMALAGCLEDFHEDWTEYVRSKREVYHELNHFTVQQLVLLQQELIRVGPDSPPRPQVLALLSLVLPGCSQQQLYTAMQQAQEQILHSRTRDPQEEREEESRSRVEPEEHSEETFIKYLMDLGYSRKLALAALEHVNDPADLDDGGTISTPKCAFVLIVPPATRQICLVWCMEQDDEEEEMEVEPASPIQSPKKSPSYQGWQATGQSVASSATSWIKSLSSEQRENVSVERLKASMRDIWTKFLEAVSSSVADYLSLEHLAIILQRLACMSTEEISRSLPPTLKKSTPNLIVCPQVDVLKTVIHMYMHSPDQPLPRPDEVLLCNSNTSIDQVDGFLRRAFFASQGKLHCLVSADLLDYEVGEKTEKKLKEYVSKAEKDFQLLVVCSGENEYRARIVAALDRHRCHPPVVSNAAIRTYLRKKLSSKSNRNTVYSASHVDFDSSTVRVVKSKRAGVGKTLYKRRLVERLQDLNGSTEQRGHPLSVSVPLYERRVCTNSIAQTLLKHTSLPEEDVARIFHFDISYDVQDGVDAFLFNLLVLGCITSDAGLVWLRSPMDLYVIETIPLVDTTHKPVRGERHLMHNMLEVLPEVQCWSPQESLRILQRTDIPDEYRKNDQLFDQEEFESEVYQRPYQYLKRFDENRPLIDVDALEAEGDLADCLQVLLRHCGIPDPSWAELRHFIWFLNTQLADFERSSFCGAVAAEDLPGFAKFLLRFLFQMSRDFATRSLRMAEESPLAARAAVQEERGDGEDAALELFQMRRTWESSPHPYIFFNPDGHSMTFLGFNIDRGTGNLVDHQTGAVLENAIMDKALQESLHRNNVPLYENFDALDRPSRLTKLASVMGMEFPFDPDETYELTTDNVKKMMAIYMRFRCGIPVIIMGETGCGKTRLVKFLCQLQAPLGVHVNNMVLMKVHGGTTAADITRKVRDAELLAMHNAELHGPHMYTVLFFDEANSTEAIGLIKEILCDGSMGGQPLALSNNLKMVAACNPYRKHSEELIKRLEKAGLGYHVDADQTVDRLGRVPMRRLVYRVQPLPQSMLPLVWDFGQLRTDMEEKYIRQMVGRYVRNGSFPIQNGFVEVLSQILIEAQEFMRRRDDECSFVSLRDVERTLQVMSWFYTKAEEERGLFDIIDPMEPFHMDEEGEIFLDAENGEESEEYSPDSLPDDLTKSLILALAVCYRACLQTREDFDEAIAAKFQPPLQLPQGVAHFRGIIERAQEAFMDNVTLEKNIARNHALSENVFMMVVCTELRIPLFLVGKPGSSKSLAKTIVADAMQGNSAHFHLFRSLKQTHMVSFQCSPLSTADGIVGTFRQCAQFQKDKNLDTFVSVVVLDEVGLAEDSPKMPLKTLHPLLEDGCQGDEKPEPFKKVAFIGISNWALDPAKMNRGILVQREVPDEGELINSAEGICSSSDIVKGMIQPFVKHLATGYLKIFGTTQTKREFFGLRDYYSLVKMIYGFAAKSKRKTCWHQLEHSIRRNFGGLDHVDPVDIFSKELPTIPRHDQKCHEDDPDCDAARLIEAGLFGDDLQSESRYLLLLTENYGALNILQQQVFASHDAAERTGQRRHVVPQTIFGSSFPKDQEYTQICRNINKIKVCMETGHTVILLNLENLYESLYDALNQYYAKLGGEKYVDLGLGTHRVKCRVHRDFKLIVVAEKQVVYDKFPIPLINRLEKHFLTLSNLMSPLQLQVAEQLHRWATKFAMPRQPPLLHQRQRQEPKPGDVFMGYHPDATAALVLQHWDSSVDQDHPDHRLLEEISRRCRNALLECATPDAVLRLKDSKLYKDELELTRTYFLEQQHDSLLQYLHHRAILNREDHFFAQVTTHSKLLTDGERLEMAEHLGLEPQSAVLLTLQSFDTEQQFSQQIRNFVNQPSASGKLLLVQCNSGHNQMDLLKCAQYSVVDALPSSLRDFYVIFIVQLPRIAGDCFSGFQAGKWHSLHIDDLRQPGKAVPSFLALRQLTPSALLQSAMPGQPLSPRRVESQPGPAEESRISATANEREDVPMETEDVVGLEDIVFDDRELFGEGEVPREREVPEEREIQEEPTQEHEERPGGQACFDPESFRQLILSCLQAAVAMVQDADPESQRPMERIDLLLSLISPDSPQYEAKFLSGLCGLIAKLLKEKEDAVTWQDGARDWLVAEAARLDLVKKAGTFRRAWMQCLESKVTPILGGIVAFLDTHCNLDLVVKGQPWQQDLWLAVLLSPETCDLHYASLTSPEKRHEATKMAPHTTTAHGATFAVQLPFSWLLLQPLDALLSQSNNTNEHLDTLESVIENIPFCGLLMSVAEGSEKNIIKAYVHDFIHSKYKLQTEQGYDLLCETLVAACHQMGQQILAMPLPRTLVALHWVHREAEARLHSFLSIERVWPQVIDSYLNRDAAIWQQGDPPLSRLDSTEELTLDVAGLYLLLNELEPHKDQLNTARGRQQWLTKVTKFSPTVTTILNTLDSATPECGPRCLIFIEKARYLWNRVLAMKLFVDHFFPANAKTPLDLRCMPLWGFLGPKANLKTLQTLEKVEKFLKTANKDILKKTLGELPKCPECETESEAPLLNLPCKHRICVQCFQDMQALRELACPECQHPIPAGFAEDKASQSQGEDLAKFEEYQRRCNSFLMALVAKLCFAGDSVPEPAAVERILSYVMRKSRSGEMLQTKQLTLFDNLVDPSPVVRSFLLQLLIRKREEDTKKHLEEFFSQAHGHCRRRGGAGDSNEDRDLREFALLVLHCLEDMHHENTPSGLLEKMEFVVDQLWAAREDLLRKAFDLTKISALAYCRQGLEVVAGLIYNKEIARSLHLNRNERDMYQKLLKATRALMLDVETEWPRNFLLKQLCREHGVESYYSLVERRDFHFLKMEEIVQVKQCQDRFLVCGRDYQQLRDTMTTILLGEDVSTLKNALAAVEGEREVRERAALLALYRCVTMSFLQPDAPPDTTKGPAVEALEKFVQKSSIIRQKELAQALLGNRLGGAGSPLVLVPGQSLGEQSLVAWLLHFRLLLSRGPRLLQPLSALALQPQNMQNSLLPTMPEDDARRIHQVLLAARHTTADNPVLYLCPNGHPYIIGDCGRPAVRGYCNVCRAVIGGESHMPAEANVVDQGQDRTETGYILGPAAQRSVQAVPERNLTPGACSLLRLLTHAALLLGAGTNSQAVMNLVKPQHRAGVHSMEVFFWDHLWRDFEVLQRCLGKSVDDIFSLLHCLVEAMWVQRNAGWRSAVLASKEERQEWETEIDRVCLTPTIQGSNARITELNEAMAQDKNLGQDRLLCLMYEVGSPPSHLPPDSLHLDPAVWRYRERITVAHFFQRLDLEQEAGASLEVLRLFRKECLILQALRHVPELLQFQRLLLSLYHRRLDRSEALKIPIRDLLTRSRDQGVRLGQLLDVFIQVWESVKGHLVTYGCWTLQAGMVWLPEAERSVVLTPDSPCAFFLPATRGPGLVAYILTEFLLRHHNHFMEDYCSITRRRYEDLAEVQLRNLTASHLVCLELERDLLPLVLANCNYSFQMGKGTQVEYDFHGFQRELVEQFLQSKARVHQQHHVIPVETMSYRADTTAAIKFKALRDRLPQEPLSPASRHQISSQLPGLPEICQCLSDLDVAISFLQSLGGEPGLALHYYMVDVLRMAPNTLCSQKARQVCQLKHVQSLWLLLCFERAKILAHHRQEAFDSLGQELQAELKPEQKAALGEFCQDQRLSLEKLECLLQQLFDCILLRIAQSATPQEGEDEAFDLSGQKLRDVLVTDLDVPLYADTENPERLPVTADDLANLPEDITGSQAAQAWLCIFHNIGEKKRQLLY